MKNIPYLLVALSAIVLSSCLDTEEKIVLKADNSGTYSLSIDLGRMLKIASTMGGAKQDSGHVKEKKDTIVYLKTMLEKADNITEEEKILYRDATVHMSMDEAKNEMKILVSSPFKNMADLVQIKNNLPAMLDKLKALEKTAGEEDKPAGDQPPVKMDANSTNPLADQFSFAASRGKISNTLIDISAFKKKVAEDSSLLMLNQMKGMMGDLNYRTILVLPRPVRKHQGPASLISGDKKRITFYTTLTEMMDHPEKVSYSVEY